MANYNLTQTGEEVQRILNSVQTIDASVIPGSSHPLTGGAVFTALSNTVAESGVYDVTVNNNNAKFASLSALLNSENLDTLIPIARRKGGMSIKFVHTYDNKYVQARCMSQNFTTDVTQWQGVDDEPTAGSKNLIESGGVEKFLAKNIMEVPTPEYESNKYIDTSGVVHTYNNYGITSPILLKANETIWLNLGQEMYVPSGTSILSKVQQDGTFIEVLIQKGSKDNDILKYNNNTGAEIYVEICARAAANKFELGYIISSIADSAPLEGAIKGWILSEAFTVNSATYTDGMINSPVNVVWPDGINGTLTITRSGDLVSSIIATHNDETFLLSITRDSEGNTTSVSITKQ